MKPSAAKRWPGPRWTLAPLLACLCMLGPFAIDIYLPAFAGIGASLNATPVQMQQMLSSYLLGFALMNRRSAICVRPSCCRARCGPDQTPADGGGRVCP